MRLKDKVAIITGGSRGIGRAVCLELAAGGANLMINYAGNLQAAEETAQAQTFHSMEGLSDKKGVSFESVLMPGQYLTLQDGKLVLTDGSDKKASTFYLN